MGKVTTTTSLVPTALLSPVTSSGNLRIVVNMDDHMTSRHLLSGSLTINTYLEIVSISTGGWLRLCGIASVDSVTRTLGLKIIMDGATIFDEVGPSFGTADAGYWAVGAGSTLTSNALEYINFNSSLSISVKSSLSETDKIALLYLTAVR